MHFISIITVKFKYARTFGPFKVMFMVIFVTVTISVSLPQFCVRSSLSAWPFAILVSVSTKKASSSGQGQ